MKTVEVNASRRYFIHIEEGLLSSVGAYCAKVLHGAKILLLTDTTVGPLYGNRVRVSLEESGFRVAEYTVPAGESSKSTAVYLQLVSFLAEHAFTRSDALVALGGGVVGDLGGFCAATYLRGIGFVQIPTTLLACVDSSVGGKTAVNLPEGKNLLGAFYQPWAVLCDPQVLATLTPAEYADGMAEVIKYGMIWDAAFLSKLEQEALSDAEIIHRCVTIKRDVVEADEQDRGCRQLLNFGHTVGHAVEKCSGFSVSHGSAVAIGMAIVSRALVKKGALAAEECRRLLLLLEKQGLPTACDFTAEVLWQAALADKKRVDDRVGLITVPHLGEARVESVTLDELHRYIEMGLTL